MQFKVRRDAGTFTFEGVIRSGVGAGTFTFDADPAFPGELVKRGFARPTRDQQYAMARHDVGYAFIDELTRQGYSKSDTAELVRAGQHGVQTTYLRGASGYFVVVDGTRPETLEKALELHQRARTALGPAPCIFLLNKSDLDADWRIPPESLDELRKTHGAVQRTSAKSGDGVEDAFVELTRRMLAI